jgi:hypothetical protein
MHLSIGHATAAWHATILSSRPRSIDMAALPVLSCVAASSDLNLRVLHASSVGFRHVFLEEDKGKDHGQEQTSEPESGGYTCRISSIIVVIFKKGECKCGVVIGYLIFKSR